jgi:hypothetical protein
MPAHRALWQLQRGRQLTHGERLPLQRQQQPTPGGISELDHTVVNGKAWRGHVLYMYPDIRMKG